MGEGCDRSTRLSAVSLCVGEDLTGFCIKSVEGCLLEVLNLDVDDGTCTVFRLVGLS